IKTPLLHEPGEVGDIYFVGDCAPDLPQFLDVVDGVQFLDVAGLDIWQVQADQTFPGELGVITQVSEELWRNRALSADFLHIPDLAINHAAVQTIAEYAAKKILFV